MTHQLELAPYYAYEIEKRDKSKKSDKKNINGSVWKIKGLHIYTCFLLRCNILGFQNIYFS